MKYNKWLNWIDLRKKHKYEITKYDIFTMLFDTDLSNDQFREILVKVFEQE